MDTSIVSPGELQVGMFLTVYEVNYLNDRKKWNENNSFPMMLLSSPMEIADYGMYEKMKGITMKAVSIQLPYIAVMILNDAKAPIIAIDSRKCILMELKEDFVKKFI